MDNQFKPCTCGHMREVRMADAARQASANRHSNTYTNWDMLFDTAHGIRRAIKERFPVLSGEDSPLDADSTHTLSSALCGIAGGIVIGSSEIIQDSRLFKILSAMSSEMRSKLRILVSKLQQTPSPLKISESLKGQIVQGIDLVLADAQMNPQAKNLDYPLGGGLALRGKILESESGAEDIHVTASDQIPDVASQLFNEGLLIVFSDFVSGQAPVRVELAIEQV